MPRRRMCRVLQLLLLSFLAKSVQDNEDILEIAVKRGFNMVVILILFGALMNQSDGIIP